MTMTVTPIDATLGAVVTDVDLSSLTDETWAEVHAAFLGAFAGRFGKIEQLGPKQTGPTGQFTNQKEDGSLANADDQAFKLMKGNEGWHTDSTYMPLASKAAMLSALVVPPVGGETGFADMRAAFDALS